MDDSLDIVWKALADPTRRVLLDELRDGPKTTGDLVERVPELSRFGVMKHLDVLEEAGLLLVRREGRVRWNALNAVPLRQVYERWVSKYEDQWAGSLVRLKRSVERREEADMSTKLLEQPARVAVIEMAMEMNAPREKVFEAFINDTADWFYETEETKHTHPARIDPRVGGKFSIYYENGDENLLAMVTLIKKNKELRLRGDFTVPQAFVANVTIKFEDSGKGTNVSIVHRMAGDFSDDMPAGFDGGWLDGLEKLKAHVES